mgnify:CR=1 FL=1
MKLTISLHDAIKQYTDDQDKIISPDETVRRFKRRLADLDLELNEAKSGILPFGPSLSFLGARFDL